MSVNSVFSRHRRLFLVAFAAALMLMSIAPAFAQTPVPPPTIDVDPTPIFDSMNAYIPLFIGIFAIPGGIVLAITLVRMFVNLITGAIKGATSSR